MDRQDRLNGFESIEHVSAIDPLNVAARLEEFSRLQDGWLDGKGLAPSKDGLLQLGKFFRTSFDADLPRPYLYPTAEAGVQAEWNIHDWAVTLEINLDTFQSEYQALNLKNAQCDDRTLDLSGPGGWNELRMALSQLEKQPAGDRSSGS